MQYSEIPWEYAQCRDTPTRTFYPTIATAGHRYRKRIAIRAHVAPEHIREICEQCPIKRECLAWGLRHEAFGIWGGLTSYQREVFRVAWGVTLIALNGKRMIYGE